MTQRGQLERDDSGYPLGWNYSYVSATGATLVKSGAGVLHCITINKPVGGCVISLCDSLTANSGTFGQVVLNSSTVPTFLKYDVAVNTGLLVNVSTAASDITISYV